MLQLVYIRMSDRARVKPFEDIFDVDAGAALINWALVLNPNLSEPWHFSGWVRVYLGEPEAAIEHFARAMRLSPLDLA